MGFDGIHRDIQFAGDFRGAQHPGEEPEHLSLTIAELLDDQEIRRLGGRPASAVARAGLVWLKQAPMSFGKLRVAA